MPRLERRLERLVISERARAPAVNEDLEHAAPELRETHARTFTRQPERCCHPFFSLLYSLRASLRARRCAKGAGIADRFGLMLSEPNNDRAPGALDETVAMLADGRLRLRAHRSIPIQQAAAARPRCSTR